MKLLFPIFLIGGVTQEINKMNLLSILWLHITCSYSLDWVLIFFIAYHQFSWTIIVIFCYLFLQNSMKLNMNLIFHLSLYIEWIYFLCFVLFYIVVNSSVIVIFVSIKIVFIFLFVLTKIIISSTYHFFNHTRWIIITITLDA